MKHLRFSLLLGLLCIIGMQQVNAQQLAFPEAEGFGRFATGGRGGEVYHVTNLNDSGPGSFRDAVSKSNRIVVFDVGGVINVGSRIVIHKNITVAGQTAPGGGITLYGNGVALNSSSGNSIIRYIRIRMGQNGDSRKDALGISDGQNYIFDHVSVSWGWDGTLDVNGSAIDDITFQDCIISQGIDIVGHSTGGLMQSGKWSMIRSLYIDNETRNPKGKGTHEMINNVIYNWGSDGYIMGATDGLSEVNFVGNWFIYGPSSSAGTHITRTTEAFHVYAGDNWVDDNTNGILDATPLTDYHAATLMNTPYNYDGMRKLMPASEALQYVIENVGGSYPARDAVDEYLIDQLTSYGTKGAIIVRESDNGIPNNVGTVANGTPPIDSDRDGMPDYWEIAFGTNPNEANPNDDADQDGYTNIENYLNWLVAKDRSLPMTIIQENEAGFCHIDGTISRQLSGYTGEGYSIAESSTDKGINWAFNVSEAKTYPVLINYSNGSAAFKNTSLIVNGIVVDHSVKFNSTDQWGTWQILELDVPLTAGKNQLRIQANDNNGLPAIDYLALKGTGIEAGTCTGFTPPVINFMSPKAYENVFATQSIEVQAFDPEMGLESGEGIEKLVFELTNNGQIVATYESAKAPYIWNLNTESLVNGTYTLNVTALSTEEAGGTSNTKELPFIIKNQLPVIAIQMAENDLLTGNVSIDAISYDPDAGVENGMGIEHVIFELLQGDDVIASSSFTEAPYKWTFNSESLPNGPLTLRATTSSKAGYGTVNQTQDLIVYAWNYPKVAPKLRFEAEQATVYRGLVLSAHKGYSGTGYVNFIGDSATPPGYVEWTVTIPKEQYYTIDFGYSGKGYNDTLTLSIPDVLETDIVFPSTADWKTREVTGIKALLPEGEHTFKLWSNSTKRAEIDYLEIPDGSYLAPLDTPMTVSIVSPLTNRVLTGQTTIEAIANDPDSGTENGDGVSNVLFELITDNNVVLSETDNTAPYLLTLLPSEYPNGTYMLRASAYGETGNTVSQVAAFSIQNCRPVVSITSPADNQSLTGDYTILATAFDPDKGNTNGDGIEKVLFELLSKGEVISSSEVSEAPYSFPLATKEFENGAYTLRTTAISLPEYGGTSSAAEHTIYISNNPPVIDILSPAANETIKGIYTISVTASDPDISSYDNNGVESLTIQLLKDNTVIDSKQFETPDYTWDLNTLKLENGDYSLFVEVIGTPEAGNEQTSMGVDFKIFNQAPEVSLTNVTEGTVLHDTFSIIAKAFDLDEGPNNGDGIANVAFQLLSENNVLVQHVVSTPPYYWNLPTTDLNDGNYTLKAIATSTQSAGGTSVSTQIGVSVNNGTTPASEITIQEATIGFCGLDGTVDNNNAGFTGDGFCNTDNATEKGVNWKIEVQEKASYQFTWRYANGSSARNGDLMIDGEIVAYNIPLTNTGSWTTWTNSSITVLLDAGTYDVRLNAISSGGLANIDYMKVSGPSVVSTSCNDPYSITQAEDYSSQSGIQTEDCSEGGQNIGYIHNGDWILFNSLDFYKGTATFTARAASSTNGGNIEIRIGAVDGPLVGICPVTATGGWQTYADFSCEVSYVEGIQNIYLVFTGGDGYLMNLNYFWFTEPGQDYLVIQENEDGFCNVNGTVDSNNSGFTGAGFANTDNTTGSAIEWSVEVPHDGIYTFSWRYANGSSNRPGKLFIDGNELIANADLNLTGSWTTWTETSGYDLPLTAGTHIVRLEATTSGGLANIDYLKLNGDNPTPGICTLNTKSAKLDLDETIAAIKVTCFPVPVADNLNIQFSEPLSHMHTISLFDSTGKILKTSQMNGLDYILNMNGLPQGLYLLKISGPEVNTTEHIVKK